MQPFQGQLPVDENGLNNLIGFIRRMGHVLEKHPMAINRGTAGRQVSPGATSGGSYFPTWPTEPAAGLGQAGGGGSWDGAAYGFAGMATPAYDEQQDDGYYYVPYDNDTDTESEDGIELDGSDFPSNDSNEISQYLYSEYWLSKRRWRRFTGRLPRRNRFGGGKGFKGKGKGAPRASATAPTSVARARASATRAAKLAPS